MKCSLLAGFSIATSCLMTTPVLALPGLALSSYDALYGNRQTKESVVEGGEVAQVTPFTLVRLAYQGYLATEGIPTAGGLISQYTTRAVTAEDLVQAAIRTNRLSASVDGDEAYLRAVDNYLIDLRNSRL
ncbi:hypothetical protein IQ268_06980 [Oculatella sp. LEGE 06141]|uniref:hypothetical protein n=1 Tax=Oculatella sp. LEGE 06141 TaxID=1828648 RepID=UPI001880F1C8|nr:hypothetical protein [Oculatella sp. LEGE 06141]MBE9178330.1 hypothetical protein [Oculatella sp. LEGE 06141]